MLQTTFPTSVALMSAVLKQDDISVDLFDTTFYKTEEISSDEYRMEHLQVARFDMGKRFRDLRSKKQMFKDLLSHWRHEIGNGKIPLNR